jgi:hypothetical protein
MCQTQNQRVLKSQAPGEHSTKESLELGSLIVIVISHDCATPITRSQKIVLEQLTCDLTLPNAGAILLEFQFPQHCDSKLWNDPWMIPHFRIAFAETSHQHPDSEESTTFALRNAHAPPPPRQRQIACTRIAFC